MHVEEWLASHIVPSHSGRPPDLLEDDPLPPGFHHLHASGSQGPACHGTSHSPSSLVSNFSSLTAYLASYSRTMLFSKASILVHSPRTDGVPQPECCVVDPIC